LPKLENEIQGTVDYLGVKPPLKLQREYWSKLTKYPLRKSSLLTKIAIASD